MKRCNLLLVVITIIVIGISIIPISRQIRIALQEKIVTEAENNVWIATLEAYLLRLDVIEFCRRDVYLPLEPPPEALRKCEDAENNLRQFRDKAYIYASDLDRHRKLLQDIRWR